MKYVNFIFQVHQPFRLQGFHFFDIGSHKSYYDEDKNKAIFRQVAERSYLPTNRVLIELIKTYGERIKISLAISGTALDQMELYAPEVLESFQQLAATGNIEFLGQTYSASLASLVNKTVFYDEVSKHQDRITALLEQTPISFLNTELIYSDDIGAMISDMGFKAMIIEGLPAILKNRNAYAIYNSASSPSLKLLLRNQSLSDDISLRFSQRHWSEWPLTADKYLNWLKALNPNEKVVNLVMDYATFGEHYKTDTGIFDFFKYLFLFLATEKNIKLSTPKEIITTYKSQSKLMVKHPVSWAGKEKSISVWEGNQMQQEAFETLYECQNNIRKSKDKLLLRDWKYLQSADHFYYMDETNEFGQNITSPYSSNYEAFINYMNVLSDFVIRIENSDNENFIKNAIKYVE